MEQRRTIQEILQEEADEISIEKGQKFVQKVLLSNVIKGKKQPKKKTKRKKK